MYNIINLKKKLPFKLDRIYLDILTYKDIDWYIDTLKKDFFNEFIDYKFTSVSDAELRFKVTNLAMAYKLNMKVPGEARLIIKDKKTDEYLGGCTIYETDNNSVDIGYWILPAYQGKGYAKELMNHISELVLGLKNISNIRLVIREDNIKSLMVAEKCGFTKTGSFKGKYKENIIYEARQLNGK